MPSDSNAKWRVRLAFLSLIVVFSAGAYYVRDLGKLYQGMAARESRTAVQGAADGRPRGEARDPHPRARGLVDMAIKAADETNTAFEKLSNEIAPPGILKNIDFFASASQGDLEALRRDLKTAQGNATTFLPRYVALLDAERAALEKYARDHADRATAAAFLAALDRRHADITAFMSRLLAARADYYRTYDDYVAYLAQQYGAYKIVKGQFQFPLQYTYDRYNAVARPMAVAASRVGELEQEGTRLRTTQREQWTRFVDGK